MPTSNPAEFAARIKEAAGSAGIYSPRELARLLGVQQQAVNQWYQGKSRPNGRNLANLLSLLHVRYEWLLYGKSGEPVAQDNAGYSDPATDFADALAVLKGMSGLLMGRSSSIAHQDAEKIGRAITNAAANADKAFQALLKARLAKEKQTQIEDSRRQTASRQGI
jgi:transcriptional regulator with XRE-family HTH domain